VGFGLWDMTITDRRADQWEIMASMFITWILRVWSVYRAEAERRVLFTTENIIADLPRLNAYVRGFRRIQIIERSSCMNCISAGHIADVVRGLSKQCPFSKPYEI
jgi:hypothetical protein